MEKEINMNLNQVSKKLLEKNKRLDAQAEEFIKEHYAKLAESKKQREASLQEQTLYAAGFSQGSAYMKNKARAKAMQEYVEYKNNASTYVMADILTNIAESSLLLDLEDYKKLNPSYKREIKETVLSFLENADLEKNISNKKTLKIMEHIAKNLPDVRTGVYLKEDEIVSLVQQSTPAEVVQTIEDLSGDVKERVAGIVQDEQEKTQKIEDEIQEIIAVSEAAKAKVEPEDEMLEENPEVTSDEEIEDAADVVTPESEEEPEDEYLSYQQDNGAPSKPKETKIEISPEGQVKVSIKESFYKEKPKKGILETLALNEAVSMIKEGKEYNGDLAIANAIMYITILETFNATGLLKISAQDYKNIINVSK